MRGSGLDLTHGAALALVCVSGAAGLATLALCWRSRFGLARLTAALAVAAVVVGWAAAQAPRFLPGMTVTQAAAGESTLVALVIAVACGSVDPRPVARAAVHAVPARAPRHAGVARAGGDARRIARPVGHTGRGAHRLGRRPAQARERTVPAKQAGRVPRHAREWGGAAVVGLVTGAVLLVFTDATWTHALGVAGLAVVCNRCLHPDRHDCRPLIRAGIPTVMGAANGGSEAHEVTVDLATAAVTAPGTRIHPSLGPRGPARPSPPLRPRQFEHDHGNSNSHGTFHRISW